MKKGFLLIGTAVTAGLTMMSLASCGNNVSVEALKDYSNVVTQEVFMTQLATKSLVMAPKALALEAKMESTSGFTYTETETATMEQTHEVEKVKATYKGESASTTKVEYSATNSVLYVEKTESSSMKSAIGESSDKSNEKTISALDALYSYSVDLNVKTYTKSPVYDYEYAKESLQRNALYYVDDPDLDFDFNYYGENVTYYVDGDVFTIKITEVDLLDTEEDITQLIINGDEIKMLSKTTEKRVRETYQREWITESSSKVTLGDEGFTEEDARIYTTTDTYFTGEKSTSVTKRATKIELKNVDPKTTVDYSKYTEIIEFVL